MNKVLLLLCVLISEILTCAPGKRSAIKETVSNIAAQMPTMIANLAKRQECKTEALHPICNKGYKYWNSVSEAHYYKGVYKDGENLEGFLDVVFDALPFTKSDTAAIKDILMLLEFTDLIDMFGLETLFEKYRTSTGSFFNLLFEENCNSDDELDFLITMINSQFKLGDEVFLVEYGEGNIFSGTHGQKVVKEPASLTYDQLDALMQLFEVSVYSNADRIIRLLDGL